MKITKILIIACTLFQFSYVNAQSTNEIYKILEDSSSMIKPYDLYVDFSIIYYFPEKSKDWLYSRLFSWTVDHYVKVASDEREAGVISAKDGITKLNSSISVFGLNWFAEHSLKIEVKDGKVRITYTLYRIGFDGGNYINAADIYPRKKYGKGVNKGALKEYYHAFVYFNNSFNDIQNVLTEKKDSSW